MKLIVASSLLLALACWGLALAFSSALWMPAVASLVLAVLVSVWWLLQRARAERASRALESALAAQAESLQRRARPDRQLALRALTTQFQEALAALRTSKLAHGRGGALYALPWYVIIGPPGTGKSTAIRESGLSFPLAAQAGSVRGIGGTRHCDWWLTNEAILLDMAGRYATTDDDRDEWLGFLDLLRDARPRRPLNGLIVALSIGELRALDETARAELAGRLRARVDEVMTRLEVRLPVYLLLTKCDLLPGFRESFADLAAKEREQVLGFTLPVSSSEALATTVERAWLRMVQTLERRAVLQVARLAGVPARHAAYGFPLELERLGAKLTALLALLFVDNVYRDAPILRGVYLTSGTQLASTAEPARQPDLSSPSGHRARGSSYFLAELFRSVIFADSTLAMPGAEALRRAARFRTLIVGGTLVLGLGLAIASGRALAINRRLLQVTMRELTDVRAAESPSALLAALAPLRARLESLESEVQAGRAHELGLDQRRALLRPLRAAYAAALREVLLRPRIAMLERALSEAPLATATPRAHALFDDTKAYLLLTEPKGAGEPALDGRLREWLATHLLTAWVREQDQPISDGERSALAGHMASYLALLASDPGLAFARDGEPLRRARAELGRAPPVELAVERIVAAVEPLGLDLAMSELAGGSGLPWRARSRVRGAFTRRGWEAVVRQLLKAESSELVGEAWVIDTGPASGRDERGCALREAYFERYIEEWRAFLDGLQMEEPADRARALSMLQDLTRGQPSPLERLMASVATNAQLLPESAGDVSEGMFDRIRKQVTGGGPLGAATPAACQGLPGEEGVRRALEAFYTFGAAPEPAAQGAPAVTSAQIYQEQLAYLRDALQAAHDDPAQGEALLARASSVRTRVRSLIEAQPIGLRPRFERLLWPAVQGSSASATSALLGEQARAWCSAVVLPHDRSLRGRYPFARRGQDAALADLADFYRPGTGTLWTYYASVLQRDLPQSGADFEPRNGQGAGRHYTPALLRFLQRARALSSALFPPGAEAPRVDLEVRVRPAPEVAQVLLTVDGQVVDFHNGPERWVHLTWPGTSEARGASLRVRGATVDEAVVQDGEWGLFRLLEQSELTASAGERHFTARWRLHTQHDVLVDLRPARSENPLAGEAGLLPLFRGPGSEPPRALTDQAPGCRE